MKKLIAVLCAAAMVAVACVPAFAAETTAEPTTETTTQEINNGSPQPPIDIPTPPPVPYNPPAGGGGSSDSGSGSSSSGSAAPAAPAASSTAAAPAAQAVTYFFKDYDASKFADIPAANKDKVQKVLDLFNDGQAHTLSEILEIMGVTGTTLQAKDSNKVVTIDSLDVISKLLCCMGSDGNLAPASKVNVSNSGNELTKGAEDGSVFVLSMDITKDPVTVSLNDAKVDASNLLTTTLQSGAGAHLLVKSN